MSIKADLLASVTEQYLESRDFNGLPSWSTRLSALSLKRTVKALLREGKISINFGDRHPNPHILAFDPEPVDEQLRKVDSRGVDDCCIYPSTTHLTSVVAPTNYAGRPFTLRLALGEPQLKFLPFDLWVLETYRNDPRYEYETDDIQGRISIRAPYYETGTMRESDHIVLQTFGFAYSLEMHRAVAVYLRYLADLTPEHQQIWNAHLLTGDYRLHPDYYRSTILGEWYEGVSIFDAFIEELHQINTMANLMGRPGLLKDSFKENRPKHFAFLIRPTLREYNDFIHLLDKMLSENLNRGFFLSNEATSDALSQGTIAMLQEWIESKWRPHEKKPVDDMFATLRRIRRLRQRPAHAMDEDEFDQKYFLDQRELIQEAYVAVRTLRLILANHPAARAHKVPDWLYQGTNIRVH